VARLALIAIADDEPPRPAMRTEYALGLRLLDEFLAELDADRRVVFVLTEIEGMRSHEIGRALGVNANTVRSRLRAARQAFEHRFGDDAVLLVERAANVEAPPEASARTLAVLGLPLTSLAPTAKGALGVRLGLRGLSGGLLGGVIGSLVLVSVVAIVGGVSREQPPRPAKEAQRAARHALARSNHAVVEATEPNEPAEWVTAPIDVVAVERPTSVRSTTRRPREPVDPETAARERLARARRALLEGDAIAALALVDTSSGWPATLDAHRVALEIGALCRLNRAEQARARADAWLRTHPNADTAISLRAVCWDDDNTSSVGGHQAP
jgi:hypothetical protein